jgi:hypothetical protein
MPVVVVVVVSVLGGWHRKSELPLQRIQAGSVDIYLVFGTNCSKTNAGMLILEIRPGTAVPREMERSLPCIFFP